MERLKMKNNMPDLDKFEKKVITNKEIDKRNEVNENNRKGKLGNNKKEDLITEKSLVQGNKVKTNARKMVLMSSSEEDNETR